MYDTRQLITTYKKDCDNVNKLIAKLLREIDQGKVPKQLAQYKLLGYVSRISKISHEMEEKIK